MLFYAPANLNTVFFMEIDLQKEKKVNNAHPEKRHYYMPYKFSTGCKHIKLRNTVFLPGSIATIEF